MTDTTDLASYDKSRINSFTNKTTLKELIDEYIEILGKSAGYSAFELVIFNSFIKSKNIKFISRFSNIFPIRNAVDLRDIEGTHYLYNASFMKFESENTYFASHCPIYNNDDPSNNDIDLFLKMLIDNDIKIVCIPIQFLSDISRTYKWFPDEITDTKSYTVSNTKTEPSRNFDYTLRCPSKKVIYDPDVVEPKEDDESIKIFNVRITDNLNHKEHEIQIYQYNNWPDYGVPRRLNLLCAYIYRIWFNLFNLKDNKKVLVHCSAGVGRTGTVISCIELLNKINAEYLNLTSLDDKTKITYKENKEESLNKLNSFILSNIVFMRIHRPLMVQKENQLRAILALKDFYTETDPERIRETLNRILTKYTGEGNSEDKNKNFFSYGDDKLTGGSRRKIRNRIYSYTLEYDYF